MNARLKALGEDKVNELAAIIHKALKENPLLIGGADKIDGLDLDELCHGYIGKYICDTSYEFADVLKMLVMQKLSDSGYQVKVGTMEVKTPVFFKDSDKKSWSDDEPAGSKWIGNINITK